MAAFNENGQCLAVSYTLWDQNKAYYFLAGERVDSRGSGASIYLTWQAIKWAFEELNLPVFDFCGSVLPKIEPIRRQFGGTQVPYFLVERVDHPLLRLGLDFFQ